MQDHELLTEDEFGTDLEADEFEFETGEEFTGEVEGPMDEVEELELAAASGAAAGANAANAFRAAMAAARRAAAADQGRAQQGAPSRRPQSGRWLRRGNKIVLLGV